MANPFLAGVGRALLFQGNELIGVAKTLTETTFNHSITAEDIRGGKANGLLGRYFHDSGLGITLTDALFDLNYVALTLGVPVESGAVSVFEQEVVAVAGGKVTLTHAPVAFDGSIIAWYKRPADVDWTVNANITGSEMTIAGAAVGETYCVKYFYQNDNAKKVTIKVDRVPSVLHLVILNDLFSGDPAKGSTDRWGRLITDIPAFQLEGNQDLSLNSTSAATVSLTGTAIAVDTSDNCEEDLIYGTMVQEEFGFDWRSNVVALAALNSDVELKSGDSETAVIYAVFGNNVASARKSNSYFTFTKEGTGFDVSADGVITASDTGEGSIEVAIKAADGEVFKASPAIIKVTVTE